MNDIFFLVLFSLTVTFLVWLNTPLSENRNQNIILLMRTFVIAFIIGLIYIYIRDQNCLAKNNIIKGPPDF